MKSSGRNVSQALEGLTKQAQTRGGTSAQDPDARAIASAQAMGGDLIENLQRMGQGNALDKQIMQIQRQAERTGYTPENRALINQMRQFQSGAAQDARSMGKISFTPSSGGGGGYSGGGGRMAGDPLTMLAQLLGQYKGAHEYNTTTTAVGADNNLRRSLVMEQGATANKLQDLWDEMMKQKRLETSFLQDRLSQSKQSQKSSPGTASIGIQGMSPPQPAARSYGNDMRMPGGNWNVRSSSSSSSGGSGRRVHESAIAAALRALGKF